MTAIISITRKDAKAMTMPKRVRMVRDAAKWRHMSGDTELERAVNSYLTCQFIMRRNVPADECLTEAKEIIALVRHMNAKSILIKSRTNKPKGKQ